MSAEPNPSPPGPSIGTLTFLLGRLSQHVGDVVGEALAPLGLRTRHYGILALLAEAGPLSQQVLGQRLHVDRTTMVAAVDDLERLGLAVRKTDEADRRAYRIELTSRGRATLVRATGAVAGAEDRLLAGLPETDRRRLMLLLQRLWAASTDDAVRPPGHRRRGSSHDAARPPD
ncbi:MAG: MarR family transcriptional regulator [Chloroflexi bacterium]|nr:MarR family transcriptional regulator [Chloroflexota bacterium]